MDINRLYSLFAVCLSVMPEGYPKPRLVIHESPEALVAFLGDTNHSFQQNNKYPASLVAAMADVARNAVHLPYTTLATEAEAGMVDILLHEIGHLFYGKKYGDGSDQYLDENKANAFSRRWMKKVKPLLEAKS